LVINYHDVINDRNVITACQHIFIDLLDVHDRHKVLNKVLKGV